MSASKIKKAALALVATGISFCALPMTALANATIVIINTNAPGVGFNDPTVRAPIGGNSGTTVGQQRLIAFQAAANIWGATLDSAVPIRIRASFVPLFCSTTSATLGSAGPYNIWRGFSGAASPNVWYHEALANKLALRDLSPIDPLDPAASADISARFNSSIGTLPGCLTGTDWYYGLDNNHGSRTDLMTVLLHEFGHGLGFSSLVINRPADGTVGAYYYGLPGAFDLFVHDNSTNKDWTAMTDAERAASLKNGRNVVWTGSTTTAAVPAVLTLGTPLLRINTPAAIAGVYPVGMASFGPVLNSPGLTGNMVLALDAADLAGPSTTDGCSPLTNAAAIAGKIAIVDRGSCAFVLKATNVQAAGAIGMVVADNAAGSPPPGLGGAGAITIPSVRITQAAGVTIKAQLGSGVNATLGLDMSVRAGADPTGHALLNTPDPVVPGSSVSHWDAIAFRNQLMEPAINGDLTHSVRAPEDLTLAQMRDIGWFADADVDGVRDSADACPNSTLGGTVMIGTCNTGVVNTLSANGCTVADGMNACARTATTHTGYVSCILTSLGRMSTAGILTGVQQAGILRCALPARIP